ncbi:CPBP family intramembrane glutamic endopeptidase [Ruminococcus sp.]|uniref:CPBP family intramembrane glutamic endopeptidase n=1 Tax=Ruminococcus sp. TaxID=41978 RepID=UPI0025D20A7E|nr:CPBP family intramembrane glutamic endopeptidase [Ruminococcus sp.]MBQ8966999.1 CPBP family intramembrane metalloprotease [Ruminococcus sp.]
MKNFKSAVGYSILMMLLGILPLLGAVCVSMADPSLESYAIPFCYLIGGLICILANKKLLKVDTASSFSKPVPLTFALITIAGLAWSLADVFIANRHTFETGTLDGSFKEIYIMVTTVCINPLAEELIFRLGAMTVLLIAAGKSNKKKAAALIITVLPWIGLHFPRTSARAIDLILVGIIISLIYILSKNVVYCLAFHISANLVTMAAAPFAKTILANGYLMYVGIALVAVCLPLALVKMHSRGKCVSFQPMSSLLKA